MTPEEREQMNSLAILIQKEKNFQRFEALQRELIELIGRKERRFPQARDISGVTRRMRPWKTLSGTVQKVFKSAFANQAESVEISISEAEDLFREIRIENRFTDVDGQMVALKEGVPVDVTFEADSKDTLKSADTSAR